MDGGVDPKPFLWIEDPMGEKFPTGATKRNIRPKKKEYVGWGSKPLIEFLESIGKDTSKPLSQHDVTSLILKYVNENKLINPLKKKRILCDERLHSLFGRKSVSRIKIYDLLETHFAENQEESEDELFYSSEESLKNLKKQKILRSDRKTYERKREVEVPKFCFAAINSENMKLVYLKRSLLQDLLKDPENFERKVVGSYVRLKSDPYDYFQRNSHQLQVVTGVKRATNAGDMLLEVSGADARTISVLSDDNFSEEELKDLHQRMKDGLLKQPTVGELEEKSRALHEDITKHSIERELALLKNQIDQANEKGWRREMSEYLERRNLLQTEAEQSRLLLTVPKVIAEEIKRDATTEDSSPHPKCAVGDSTRSIQWEPSYGSPTVGVVSTSVDPKEPTRQNNAHHQSSSQNEKDSQKARMRAENNGHLHLSSPNVVDFQKARMGAETNANLQFSGVHEIDFQQPRIEAETNSHLQSPSPTVIDFEKTWLGAETSHHQQSSRPKVEDLQKIAEKTKQVQVIELSDEEEEDEKPSEKRIPAIHPEQVIWHYLDPQGDVQGPFSLISLKRWRDADYFAPDFKVWKTGQSPEEALLLTDILRQMCPD
ncbi:hypothetical protein Ancab_024398 [Ancistrocladus abbreviatus]